MLTAAQRVNVSEVVKVDVFTWIEDNLPKIRGHARKYLAYSPYDLEEFIQAAYECVLKAESDTDHDFERSFWFYYKKACKEMTYSKGYKIPCFHEEYREQWEDDDTPPTIVPTQPVLNYSDDFSDVDEADKIMAVSEALSSMTKREKDAWKLLLNGISIKKTAAMLGISKTAVIKLRDSGLKKAQQAVLSLQVL